MTLIRVSVIRGVTTAPLKGVGHHRRPLPQAPFSSLRSAHAPPPSFLRPLVRAWPRRTHAAPELPDSTATDRRVSLSASRLPSSILVLRVSPPPSPLPAAGPSPGRRRPPEHPIADRMLQLLPHPPPHHRQPSSMSLHHSLLVRRVHRPPLMLVPPPIYTLSPEPPRHHACRVRWPAGGAPTVPAAWAA
jgi:hypothetical protein